MSRAASDSELLDMLCEEFTERYRRGDQPSVEEYADKHPRLAGQIRELFPALQVVEELGSPGTGAAENHVSQGFADIAMPAQLGPYRIVREIARGGMGVVYEAVEQALDRQVAVKVLPPHPSLTERHLERFRKEARAAARLHHTNIVPVYGVGNEGGIHYYAMELIRGEPLNDVVEELKRLRDGASPEETRPNAELTHRTAESLLSGCFSDPEATADLGDHSAGEEVKPGTGSRGVAPAGTEATEGTVACSGISTAGLGRHSDTQYFHSVARVGFQVADALAYAHRQGLLHRDIKPGNLLLDVQGHVWVTDFGLVKEEGAHKMTRLGEAPGTLMYMPPERFEGRSEPEGDIYSLGATLFEMLTLRPPFDAANRLALLDRIKGEEPKWPSKREGRVPRDLRTIVSKAMEKDSKRRYGSAKEMAEDLRRFLSDEPVRARRASYVERTWRWCRRNPSIASLTAVVVLLLATIAIVSSIMAARLRIADEVRRKIMSVYGPWLMESRLEVRGLPRKDGIVLPDGPEVRLRCGIRASEWPWEVIHDVRRILQPLIAGLEQKLGRPVVVELWVYRDYWRAIDAIANGDVDFMRCGPDAYVLSKQVNGLLPIIARHGDLDLDDSPIIVRKDLGVKTLQDLKRLMEERKKSGRKLRIAFGDSISGSGRFRIQTALASVGIYADDVEWVYLGRHDAVAEAVWSKEKEKEFDVGGLKGPVYREWFGEKGKYPGAVEVIHSFTGPGKPWVARTGLNELTVDGKNVFNVLQKCLLELTRDRYKEFWAAYPEEGVNPEEPPDDWGLPIVSASDDDYKDTRDRQRRSREFFDTLADVLLDAPKFWRLIDKSERAADATREDFRKYVRGEMDLRDFDILALALYRKMTPRQIAKELGLAPSDAEKRDREIRKTLEESFISWRESSRSGARPKQ